MHNKIQATLVAVAALSAADCASHYQMAEVSRSRILIDSRYDKMPDARAEAFIAPFKAKVDSVMSPVVGRTARPLSSYQPESPLSNLLTDILIWGSAPFGEKPDFALYNMGGIRAAFPAGDITYGDVLDVAPFENKICFLTLTGDKVMELFRQMAGFGGQAVSSSVRFTGTKAGDIKSLKINGADIDPKKEYRIATLDYLAEGNDKLEALKSKTKVNSPKDEKNNVRYIIMNYFKDKAARGEAVDAKVEGRFILTGE